jgi:hypothetical protein
VLTTIDRKCSPARRGPPSPASLPRQPTDTLSSILQDWAAQLNQHLPDGSETAALRHAQNALLELAACTQLTA